MISIRFVDILDISLENILKYMKHVGLVFSKAAVGIESNTNER